MSSDAPKNESHIKLADAVNGTHEHHEHDPDDARGHATVVLPAAADVVSDGGGEDTGDEEGSANDSAEEDVLADLPDETDVRARRFVRRPALTCWVMLGD